MQRRGFPCYFHLLWEEDLDELAPALRIVRDRRAEVISKWYSLYVLHFGDCRTMSEAEFREAFEPALLRQKESLLRKDMDGYARELHALGDRLVARRVPLHEIIVLLHLFEESAQSVFPHEVRGDLWSRFDKLCHVRILLLVESYARAAASPASPRTGGESDARLSGPRARTSFHGLVGRGIAMNALYDRIEAAAHSRGTILVVGESGSGKELVARAIHEAGADGGRAFVALNCAALPKDLIESELFGYKRGAFSGANSEYLGLFRAADGGSLFLDEITEMGADTQSKLLRAIQERAVRPVGSTREIPVNARIIATTNRDPREAVESGRLREDLYYRLQANVISVPALRERRDDIGLLADFFVERFNRQGIRSTPVVGFEADASEAMRAYSWPGNVRELSNAIEGAFTFGRTPKIGLSDLPANVIELAPPLASASSDSSSVPSFTEVERDLVMRALQMTNGNRSRAAKLLKISRKRLYAKMSKYGVS